MQGVKIVGSDGQDGAIKLRCLTELAVAMERHGPANRLAFTEARRGCRGRLLHAEGSGLNRCHSARAAGARVLMGGFISVCAGTASKNAVARGKPRSSPVMARVPGPARKTG